MVALIRVLCLEVWRSSLRIVLLCREAEEALVHCDGLQADLSSSACPAVSQR